MAEEEIQGEAILEEDVTLEEGTERSQQIEDMVEKRRKARDETLDISQQGEEVDGEQVLDDKIEGGEPEGGKLEDETVKIVVDGQEQVVPKSQVIEQGIRTLQKESTASQRLHVVDQRRAELDEMEKRLKLRALELERPPAQQPSVIDPEFGKKFTDAVFQDGDEAADMLQAIAENQQKLNEQLERVSAETAGTQQRFASVETVLSTQKKNERVERVKSFSDAYPVLAKDQFLFDMANNRTKQIMSANPDMSNDAIIMQAGKDVTDWLIGVTPGAVTENRHELKQSIPKQPINAGVRSQKTPEKKPKTKSEVVSDMRSARGLPEI